MTPPLFSTALGRRLARGLFRPPRRKHHRTPAEFSLPYITRTGRTSDGIELHLWLIPGSGAGVGIVGHGIGLSKSASLRQAALLHELGYHVIMFDHRNHGRSGTDTSRDHLAERYSNDIEACLSIAAETWPEAGSPIVWGFSFSTFPTLYSLRHETIPPISAIICDSGPGLDLHDLLRTFLTGGGLPGPAVIGPLARSPAVVESFATTSVKMLGASWPPDAHLPAVARTPMLFLVGAHDKIIEPGQIRALAARYPNTTVAEFPANHLRGITEAPDEYRKAVTNFLHQLESRR